MPKRQTWIRGAVNIFVVWVALLLVYGWKSTQFMLEIYTKAASTMLERGSEGVDAVGLAYPPLLTMLFIPFSEMQPLVQRVVWLGVIAVLLVFLFSTVQRMIVKSRTRRETVLFWILMLCVAGRYISSPIENYSNDFIVAGFVVLAIRLWATHREGMGGVAIGIAAACKATPLLFLPFLFLQRRWKAAMAMVCATIAAFVLPDLLFPREDGTWIAHWFSLVGSTMNPSVNAGVGKYWRPWNQLNQSISGTIYRLFSVPREGQQDAVNVCIILLSPAAMKVAILSSRVVILVVMVVAVWRGSGKCNGNDIVLRRFCEGAIISCGMLLLSPMSSKAHFILLLLPIAIMIRSFLWERRDKLIAAMLLTMFVYGTLTVKGIIGTEAGHAVLATGSVTWCTVLGMLGTWRVMWKRQSSGDSSLSTRQ